MLVWTSQWYGRSTLPLREQRDVSFGPSDGLVLRYWRTSKKQWQHACSLNCKWKYPHHFGTTLLCRTCWGRGFRSSYLFQYTNLFQSFSTVSDSFARFHEVSSCFFILLVKSRVFLRPRSSWISPNARLFASAKRRDTQKSKLGENIISISWCCQWCHLIILHPHVDKPIDFNVWHSFALLVWFHSGNRSATPSTRRLGRRWKHAAVFATYCLAKLTKLNQNLWHFLLLFGHR